MGNLGQGGEFLVGHVARAYLDWNATAPMRPSARSAWLEAMDDGWANANSLHLEGKRAAELLSGARERIASTTGTSAGEWIINSGATEGIHSALYGAIAAQPTKRRVVSSMGEHAATRAVLQDLEAKGCEVVRVPLGTDGTWSVDDVLSACASAPTALASLIWANNETGAVSDVRALAKALRQRRIPLHLDAVQVPGRLAFDLSEIPAGFVSISGHKFGGPKGVGAMLVRKATPWTPWVLGGEQERGRRSGTSQVAAAVAMSVALEEACGDDRESIAALRDRWEMLLTETVPAASVVCRNSPRLPNTSTVVVRGVESSPLLLRLDDLGFAISSGSACTSGRTEPSSVLLATGLSVAEAHSTIRISLGFSTTWSELERLAVALRSEVPRLRAD